MARGDALPTPALGDAHDARDAEPSAHHAVVLGIENELAFGTRASATSRQRHDETFPIERAFHCERWMDSRIDDLAVLGDLAGDTGYPATVLCQLEAITAARCRQPLPGWRFEFRRQDPGPGDGHW
jgi:hypothetical protein